MTTNSVSVVIVNWHSEKLLASALSALDRQLVAPEKVVVVDNGSVAALPLNRYTRGPIVALRMAKNEGFAAGNNRAIEQAVTSEWVVLLNPDALPREDWLQCLLDAAERHPDVCAFGSKQLMGEDHAVIDGLGDVYHVSGAAWRAGHGRPDKACGQAERQREIFAPCAAAAMYRRSAFLAAGGFDEDFFCYFEDVDLGFRMRLLGHKAMLVPEAVVYHWGGGTSGGRHGEFAVYHGQRNLVWAYFKNMPSGYFWLYLPQHLLFNAVSVLYFLGRGRGKAVLRAKWHALLGLPTMIGKRRLLKSLASPANVRAAMVDGWRTPYRRPRGAAEQ
jgi:GT2 family glycosyltransferase